MWEWMEGVIKDASQNPNHWLRPLWVRVQSLFDAQPQTIAELHVKNYIPDLSPARSIYFHAGRTNHRFDLESSQTRSRKVNALMEAILIQWFEFPHEPNFRSQAFFFWEIVDAIGCDALLLQPVWHIGSSVSWFLFKNVPRNPTRADLRLWAAQELIHHPLTQAGSKSRQILEVIGSQFERLCPKANALSSQVLARLPSPSPTPASTPTEGPLCLPDNVEMAKFVIKIKLLYPLLDDPRRHIIVPQGHCGTQAERAAKHLSRFLLHVQANADKKLPFRDRSPSRMRILEPGGPFGPDNISTREGLFSALIFRGVTYHTDFLLEQERVFRNPTHWQALYDKLSPVHPAVYFCDKNAYGQYMDAQNISHISALWEASGDSELGGWVTDTRPIEFDILYDVFLKGTLNKRKAFPGFGSLKSFLLATDYAVAGKATTPTLASVGKMIFQIGHGSATGLSRLGFTCSDVASTVQAFTAVHNHLLHVIPQWRREQMGFGVFFVEHALCKLNRLDSDLFRAVWKEQAQALT
jgi:hypothetical protein